MNRPPAYQHYAKDHLAKTMGMSMHHRGVKVTIQSAMWVSDEPGALPLPLENAARLAGIDPRSLRDFQAKCPGHFVEIDGKLVDLTLRAQWEEMRQRQQAQSDAAKRTNEGLAKRRALSASVSGTVSDPSASASASASAKSKSSCPPPADKANDRASQSSPPQAAISIPGMEIAVLLRQRILENNQRAKITEKQVCEWGREADFMLRLDHRTPEEISTLIDWSQRDSFWKTNILSMKTLRRHFDRLTAKMLTNAESGQPAWKRQEQAEEQGSRESWRLISQLAKDVRR